MTTLLLRADAAPDVGVGHLSRCVAMATAARARGWDVALWGTVTAGGWLLGDLRVVAAPEPSDVLLVDHYGLPQVPPEPLLVSIEDGRFGRRRADIVVDANLYTSDRPADGTPTVLRGPAYAPLRAEIREARTGRRPEVSTPPKVVVVMGGGAAPTAVSAAVEALRATNVPASVTAISAQPIPGVEVIPPTPALPTLLAAADLVVSAAGVTLLELCCIGTPTALVRIADNQKAGYEAAVTRGLAAGLGTDPRDHIEALRALLLTPEHRKALSTKAMTTVDGHGADRILNAVEAHLPEDTDNSVVVRPASGSDSALLLAWRNDPETRARSRGTDPVTAAEHEAWLTRVLADPDRRLLIVHRGRQPVGTVRFDRDGEGWEVSITVAPEARGRRLAVPVLLAAERSVRPATLRACVHRDNGASLALFRRAGYRQVDTDDQWVWFAKAV